MTDIDTDSPTFLGGSFAFEGGMGCWLTDTLGLLDDGFDGKPFVATHVAWRRATTVGAVSFRGAADLATVVGNLEGGGRPSGHDEGLPSFLRHLGHAEAAAGDRGCMASHVGLHVPGDGDDASKAARFAADLSAAIRAVDPFLLTLDPDAVRACRGRGGPEDDAEYAGFDRTLGPERALARASAAMPRMRDTLAEAHEADPAAMADAVAGRGRPLRELVRDHLAVRRGKRIAAVATWVHDLLEGLGEADAVGVEAGIRCHTDLPVQVATELALLPASWTPRTGAGFLDFAECHPAVSIAVHAAEYGRAGDMLNARGDWAGFRRRLSKACGHADPIDAPALRRAIADVDDMADSFARQVMAPALAKAERDTGRDGTVPRVSVGRIHVPWHVARRMLARCLLQEGRTVAATLEASRRWHAARWRLMDSLPGRDGIPDR